MTNRSGTVRMMYIGQNKGSIPFKKEGLSQTFKGGNNAIDRYKDVQPGDVPILERTGKWKIAKAESGIDLSQAAVSQPEPEVFTPAPKRALKNPGDMNVVEAKSYAAGLGLESLNEFKELEESGQNRITLTRFLDQLITDVQRVN